jgi:Protein of unknown function (DUF1194)
MCRLSRGEGSRAFFMGLLFVTTPCLAEDKYPVAIELVLALDCSASVDNREFRLQVEGLAEAFRDPEVLEAVENLKPFGVAVAVTQWGAPRETRVVIPFTWLESSMHAKAFGFRAGLIHRWIRASATSIATGIDDAVALIDSNEFEGYRKVIDVSGDGQDNSGADLDGARERARAGGITINGLSIASDAEGLEEYYRQNVISGSDAFVEPAKDFEDFARALKEKLLRELRPFAS